METLISIECTYQSYRDKNMMLVIGGPGQYKRPKKKKGEQTAMTAAKPYGLPLPEPVEMYLDTVNDHAGCACKDIRTTSQCRPVRPTAC